MLVLTGPDALRYALANIVVAVTCLLALAGPYDHVKSNE